MSIKPLLVVLAGLLLITAEHAGADLIEVAASEDLSIRRGDDGNPVKENGGIHPKKVSNKDESPLDRFAMIRFDSADFGKDVRAAALVLQPRTGDNDGFTGRHRFRVYGVRDGDKEDEQFNEKDYKPGAEGTLFDGSRNMVDRRQVSVLGSFIAEPGEEVRLITSPLLAFIRADRNATVTLVITRQTDSGENSVFEPRTSENSPKLVLKLADRDEPETDPDTEPEPDEAPEPETEPDDAG